MNIPPLKRTAGAPIRELPPPPQLVIPLDGLLPVVDVGDRVRAGQPVARREDGAVRHTAWTGRVTSVNGAIVIVGERESPILLPESDVAESARAAGLVGMGGAMFPTFRKIELTHSARIVLVNGCESEPFVTCDSAVLAEESEQVARGTELAMRAVGATESRLIADEREAGYPGGYEGLLVERALGLTLGTGARPSEVGALVMNVQTVRALYAAHHDGMPLLDRVVTVDGDAVKRPGNYRVTIGTPVSHLLEAVDADLSRAELVLMGGPMMGRPARLDEPIGPGSIAVLALTREQVRASMVREEPCLRCGRCEDVCPWSLSASELIVTPDESVNRCVECGACQFVCPSHIRLIPLLHDAKQELRDLRRRTE